MYIENIERLKKVSHNLYNLIAMNLADVCRFLNLKSELKVLTKRFPKMHHFLNFIALAESCKELFIFHCISGLMTS